MSTHDHPRVACSELQLREALRVATALNDKLARDGTDSVQIQLIDLWEDMGVLRVELLSNEYGGRTLEVWEIDTMQAPGETGIARRAATSTT